jgi:hypothetical protein
MQVVAQSDFRERMWFRSGLIPYRPVTSSFDARIHSWLGEVSWLGLQRKGIGTLQASKQPRLERAINIMYALACSPSIFLYIPVLRLLRRPGIFLAGPSHCTCAHQCIILLTIWIRDVKHHAR